VKKIDTTGSQRNRRDPTETEFMRLSEISTDLGGVEIDSDDGEGSQTLP